MDELEVNVIRSRTNHAHYHRAQSPDIDFSCRSKSPATVQISKTSKDPAEMESNFFPS